jgi:hypothetical protein
MSETLKLAAILVTDVVGYSRLAGTDEERTLARLRALRCDLIDPTIALHRLFRRWRYRAPHRRTLADPRQVRDHPQHRFKMRRWPRTIASAMDW